MSVDMEGWSPRKKTMHGLLRRAFAQGRGPEIILRIQWCLAKEVHKQDAGALTAAQIFKQQNEGQPQALRALNLLAEREGLNVVYKDTVPSSTADMAERTAEDMMETARAEEQVDIDDFFDRQREHAGPAPATLKLN